MGQTHNSNNPHQEIQATLENALIPSLIYQYLTEAVKLNFHLGQKLYLFTTVQRTMPWIASLVQTSLTRALHWY